MVYMIWERESYCEYDVIYITLDKVDAESKFKELNSCGDNNRYHLEEKQVNKLYEIEWY